MLSTCTYGSFFLIEFRLVSSISLDQLRSVDGRRYGGCPPTSAPSRTAAAPVLQKSVLPAPPGYCSRLISYRHSVDGADDPTAMPLIKRWPIFQLSHTSGPRGYVDCTPPGSPIPGGPSAVLRSAPFADQLKHLPSRHRPSPLAAPEGPLHLSSSPRPPPPSSSHLWSGVRPTPSSTIQNYYYYSKSHRVTRPKADCTQSCSIPTQSME